MTECMKIRRTGRSTKKALKYLSEAYSNPRTKIKVNDHYPMHENHIANRTVLDIVRFMVKDLELKGFEFNKQDCTVEYRGLCNCEVVEEFPCNCNDCGKAKA